MKKIWVLLYFLLVCSLLSGQKNRNDIFKDDHYNDKAAIIDSLNLKTRIAAMDFNELYYFRRNSLALKKTGSVIGVIGAVATVTGCFLFRAYGKILWDDNPDDSFRKSYLRTSAFILLGGCVTILAGSGIHRAGNARARIADVAIKKFDVNTNHQTAWGLGLNLRF
jgi:hypothetical protein